MFDSAFSHAAALRTRALAFCAHLTALGCAGAQISRCETPEAIALHVRPANHLNPDRAGLPRSVVMRVYQLGDVRTFENSSFEQLWTGAAQGLPAPEQLIALPGREQSRALTRDPAARYLAIAANFRERDGESRWRALVRLPAASNSCERGPASSGASIELMLADYALDVR